ncbi:MAG: zinc-binding dehydrogenase [Acidobacteria bacterium]|nr:zinc-binding dehydrogenase [Acidobacteriota bacterium]
MQAVQLARLDGGRVIAVTSSAAKADILFEAGAHEVIVSPDLGFSKAVRRVTGGQGVDLALEIVGSLTFGQTLKALAPVLPLADAAHAHDRLEKREVAGRLVLAPVH